MRDRLHHLVRSKVGEGVILIGGVDAPSLVTSDSSENWSFSITASEEEIDILAPGGSIPPGTPTENVKAMVQAAIDFGKRG